MAGKKKELLCRVFSIEHFQAEYHPVIQRMSSPPKKTPANRVIAVQFMFHFHASVFFYFTKAQYVTGP